MASRLALMHSYFALGIWNVSISWLGNGCYAILTLT